MSRKNAVVFAKPEEPAFLKKIKAKIGYKEGPDIDTKNEKLPDASDDDYADRDDEKPVVVLPKNSKITEQEAQEFIKNSGEGDDDDDEGDDDDDIVRNKHEDYDSKNEPESGGRLIFKKPDKTRDTESTNKGAKRINDDRLSSRSKTAKIEDNRKKVTNSRLLSFGDDEEEDE